MADENFAPSIRLLDFSNQGELASFKEQVNLIYTAFRQRNILMPHSVFIPRKELLRALGVVERDGELVELESESEPKRTGVFLYMTSSSHETNFNPEKLIQGLFPAMPVNPNTDASSFTIAVVATNEELGNYQDTGANFITLSECPPKIDCPPWHEAPPID
ncbi:MAG: hypothetical protein SFV55_04710 [Haliscomenobacter sp.]|uniref:hypothetical protein n=1 Tax=Haliscomenobacter sp. TaxID=2717303 RepID=UPI0029B61656|nr:hypothetical protein [Haliscomenobacter sp.]MDX2067703.1 hypothetical protein [Haliscomenobacter sp.]